MWSLLNAVLCPEVVAEIFTETSFGFLEKVSSVSLTLQEFMLSVSSSGRFMKVLAWLMGGD